MLAIEKSISVSSGGESEESIARKQQSKQVRGSTLALKPISPKQGYPQDT